MWGFDRRIYYIYHFVKSEGTYGIGPKRHSQGLRFGIRGFVYWVKCEDMKKAIYTQFSVYLVGTSQVSRAPQL